MVKRNSFTKFMLIVCGIVLMTAAFSGCADVDAPDPDESPNTQLSGAPSSSNAAASGDFAGMSPEEVYRAALDNPDALVGQPISLLVIDDSLIKETGPNRYGLQTKEISDELAKKHDGIYSYTINTNGVSPTKITLHSNDGNRIIVVDKNEDGLIDIVA